MILQQNRQRVTTYNVVLSIIRKIIPKLSRLLFLSRAVHLGFYMFLLPELEDGKLLRQWYHICTSQATEEARITRAKRKSEDYTCAAQLYTEAFKDR